MYYTFTTDSDKSVLFVEEASNQALVFTHKTTHYRPENQLTRLSYREFKLTQTASEKLTHNPILTSLNTAQIISVQKYLQITALAL